MEIKAERIPKSRAILFSFSTLQFSTISSTDDRVYMNHLCEPNISLIVSFVHCSKRRLIITLEGNTESTKVV